MEVIKKAQWDKFKGKSHSEESKIKILNKKAKASKEQVMEIKQLHKEGELLKNLCSKYKLSMSSVSRIVNNKRYKLWG